MNDIHSCRKEPQAIAGIRSGIFLRNVNGILLLLVHKMFLGVNE